MQNSFVRMTCPDKIGHRFARKSFPLPGGQWLLIDGQACLVGPEDHTGSAADQRLRDAATNASLGIPKRRQKSIIQEKTIQDNFLTPDG